MVNGSAPAIRAASVSAAPTRSARWPTATTPWPAGADHRPAPPRARQPKSNVVIRVIADQAAIDAATAPTPQPAAEAPADASQHRRRCCSGRGVLPNALLAEAIRNGATIKPIRTPGVEPEPRYRPSDELAEFVRMRDLFCRFPGCDVPADRCDIDHATPLAVRAHPCVEPELQMPKTPPDENVLDRHRRLV